MKRAGLILAALSGLLCGCLVLICLYTHVAGSPALLIGDMECGDDFGFWLCEDGVRCWVEQGYSPNWSLHDRIHVLGIRVATAHVPGSTQYDVALPYWFLISISAVLPVVYAMRLRREWITRYRGSRGLCLACGYDLRESQMHCPECGTSMHL